MSNQWFGIGLALSTAFGCIAYERLCKSLPYSTTGLIVMLSIAPFVAASALFETTRPTASLSAMKWPILVYVLSGISSPCWWIITQRQGVMVGSLYEVKYIVILALVYILFGNDKFTLNTAIGLILAMCSLYFISKA